MAIKINGKKTTITPPTTPPPATTPDTTQADLGNLGGTTPVNPLPLPNPLPPTNTNSLNHHKRPF